MYKAQRRLYLFSEGSVLRAYDLDLGFAPVGHKRFDGDGKTPEGSYIIDRRKWWRYRRAWQTAAKELGLGQTAGPEWQMDFEKLVFEDSRCSPRSMRGRSAQNGHKVLDARSSPPPRQSLE